MFQLVLFNTYTKSSDIENDSVQPSKSFTIYPFLP